MLFLPGDGFFVGPASASGDLTLGGSCLLHGAISPNTGSQLTQFARVRIDTGAFSIPDWQLPDIRFLYSWKCNIHEGSFSYRYLRNSIEIVEYIEGTGDHDCFPYENYPEAFQEVHRELKGVSESDQQIIRQLNSPDCDPAFEFSSPRADELSVPRHQFGGIPYLLDPEMPEKECILCDKEMLLVAAIGNDSYSNEYGFSGNDFVQILYWACPKCHVISALNFCD